MTGSKDSDVKDVARSVIERIRTRNASGSNVSHIIERMEDIVADRLDVGKHSYAIQYLAMEEEVALGKDVVDDICWLMTVLAGFHSRPTYDS